MTSNNKTTSTARVQALADTTEFSAAGGGWPVGSWIVSRKATGETIGEFFDAKTVARFNRATCNIETAGEYLGRINQAIAAANVREAMAAGGNRRRWK